MTEIRRKKGIYLLPNLMTTMALLAGFYAVIAAMDNRFKYAAVAIFVALVLDGLDGRIARMTKTESDFGKEYDSLADMVSFGLAPALVFYRWSIGIDIGLSADFVRLIWPVSFLFTVAAALRLARFNSRPSRYEKRYFEGLPSPAAAGCVAGFVWLMSELEWDVPLTLIVGLLVTILCAYLMISRWAYRSFKDINFGQKIPFGRFVIVPIVLGLVALNPPLVLFLMFATYVASSPIVYLIRLKRKAN